MADVEKPAVEASAAVQIATGIVKAVTDGSRIIVRGPVPAQGPPLEKAVVLKGISAPAVGKNIRRKVADSNEFTDDISAESPCGFLAREFTRKMLIGKVVKFSMDYTWVNTGQVAGNIWLQDETPGKDAGLIEKGLSAGWFSISESNSYHAEEDHKDRQLDAKNHERGQWSNENRNTKRDIVWSLDTGKAAVQLFNKYRGKELKGQVEFVLSASMLKVYLEECETYVVIQLTGVQAVNKNDATADPGRPNKVVIKNAVALAEQARFFVESRLMHRDVTIRLDHAEEGDEKMGHRIFGSVLHPKGNISELLLEEGFARCSDWSLKYYSNTKKLRDAQNRAKSQKKRVWAGYKAPTEGMKESDRSFNVIVKQIATTDSILVRHAETGQPLKITFSSVRQLNKTDFGEQWASKIARIENEKKNSRLPFSPITDIPVNHEAKEFLRKKLIGKKVKITIDYKQEPRTVAMPDGRQQSFPARTCATVNLGDTNIAEAMASRGYIKIINHAGNDDNRSSEYDALQGADLRAREGKKGQYNSNLQLPKINDINTKDKAGPFLSSFQRSSSVVAVVDYVFSGNRLKCYVPKDNVNIMVIMAGLDVPRVGKMVMGKREPGEPFADQAARFTSDHIMQQEVQLIVHGMDKHGSFIGFVMSPKHDNMSVMLLQEGLAKTHFSAERTNIAHLLYDAESKAKVARKNLWKDFNDEEDEQGAGDAVPETQNKQIPAFEAVIADIRAPVEGDRAVYVAVQRTDDKDNVETIQTDLNNSLTENPPLAGSVTVRRNETIAAKWPLDDSWYRAKVDKVEAIRGTTEKLISVTFIDFGNVDTFNMQGRVGKLPVNVDTSAFKPLASVYPLAFLEYPVNDDYAGICFEALNEELLNNRVKVSPLYTKFRAPHPCVNLLDNNGDNVMEFLINNGQAMVTEDKRAPKTEAVLKQIKTYQMKEREAMRAHKAIWRYGDIRNDDCPEFGN